MNSRKNVRFGLVALSIVCAATAGACSDPASPLTSISKPLDTLTTLPIGGSYIPATGSATKVPTRKTAAGYPIQYYISVPQGWPGNRAWPVLINLTGSGKDWENAATLFARERDLQNLPFIVITPVILTNGSDGPVPRDHPAYQYPTNVWDLIDVQGRCAFDMAGIQAIIADARNLYAGQSKPFLTAFSAGGHEGWATVLLKPELIRAAALVATNYSGRCVTKETFTQQFISVATERVLLPIRNFNGANDSNLSVSFPQQNTAMGIARANGFTNITLETVPGLQHEPMPANVLSYFSGLLGAAER